VIDMASVEGRDPYDDYVKINDELRQYEWRLMERPQVIAANKMDLPGAEANLKAFKEKLRENHQEVDIFPISAASKQGLKPLLYHVADLLEKTPAFPIAAAEDQVSQVTYRLEEEEPAFRISRDDDGAYVVSGPKIEKLFKMTDFNRDESVRRFARKMRAMGVDDALRERGIEDGDTVRILDFEFEFTE